MLSGEDEVRPETRERLSHCEVASCLVFNPFRVGPSLALVNPGLKPPWAGISERFQR